jgi:hypothetical protein
MPNKSYAIKISLLRVSLLAGQLAVSPSAAAQPALAAASQQPALSACPAFVAGRGAASSNWNFHRSSDCHCHHRQCLAVIWYSHSPARIVTTRTCRSANIAVAVQRIGRSGFAGDLC